MLSTAIRGLVRLVLAAVVLAIAALEGRRAGFIAFALWLGVLFIMVVWLPRAAHRAFRIGNYNRAKLLYKVLRLWAFRKSARASIDVSLAACGLALERWNEVLALLDQMNTADLSDAARAAWLNNRAYALARAEIDPATALECADQAIALRPDVAGFRHTRGVALLELGRVDEAIAELDRLWNLLAGRAGDDARILEAERCYDLARAWQQKGENDYALDYFHRARRASPQSRWAERATAHLGPVDAPALADLID